MDNQEIYDELIGELKQNRVEMAEMLDAAVGFRKQINTMIPSSTDFKKKWLLEEKMKLIVSIFNIELDIRKQKENSLKSEIELRRKITGDDQVKPIETLWEDSASLAKALEQLEGKRTPVFEQEVEADVA